MFFKEIAAAVGDFKFYGQAKDFSVGKSLKYIFLFLLIVTALLTVRYSHLINYGLGIARSWSEKNLPVIHIKDGAASAEAQQPYTIVVEDGAVIIDTTGVITSLTEYKRGVLLTKNEVIFKKSAEETRTYNLREIKDLTIDKNFLEKTKKMILMAAIPIILVCLYLYFCMARFLQILTFSVIALIIAAIMGLKLTYKQIFNVCAYAITTSMLMGLVAALILAKIPFFGWLYNGVYITYLIMALKSQMKTQTYGTLPAGR